VRSLLFNYHSIECLFMERYIIILVLSCCAAPGIAQLNIDSLKNLISEENNDDTTLAKRLLQVSDFYLYDKPDSGLHYANKALQLSQQLDYKDGEVWAYINVGQAYFVFGDYAQSLHYSLLASNLYRQMKRLPGVSTMKLYIGDIYREMGDYRLALRNYFDARKMDEENRDDFILMYPGLPIEQRFMLFDVVIGDAYLTGNRLDSALFFAKRGFVKDRELGSDWTYPALVLGNVYAKRKQFDSALYCYRSTFKFKAQNDLIDINNGIATIYRDRNQTDSCRYYAEMALDTAQIIHYPPGALQANELLSWVYEKTNPVKAIRYYKASIAIKDSLNNQEKVSRANGLIFEERQREQELQAAEIKYQNRLKMYGLLAVVGFFLLVALSLWRSNRHRQKAYVLLQKQQYETDHQKVKAENALEELKVTQAQLLQREKMASLGELTAGIAHEIQNPLNFVNNFSEVNTELADELEQEVKKENLDGIKSIAKDIKENQQKINHHGKRAEAIVKGMLQHSRVSSGQKELTDINALCEEYLRLAYHGFRAKDKSFNAKFETFLDPSLPKVNVVPQDIGRVILNLINNAFYAVSAKASDYPKASSDKSATADGMYEPTVSVSTKTTGEKIQISVTDNGNGIPQKLLDKIFQPFFTTKPTGQGTGLGLSLSYDIIKVHGGELNVETNEGEGAEFIIMVPIT
jgi:two-component system NtrC family sensor kinase